VRSHPHFVCTSCGKVVCLPDLHISLSQAPECSRAIQKQRFEVQLRGLCDDCCEEA
jgi:Fur family ferric uptake transcriptional regulator